MLNVETTIQNEQVQSEMQIPVSDMDLLEILSEEDIPQIPESAGEVPSMPESDIPALPTN